MFAEQVPARAVAPEMWWASPPVQVGALGAPIEKGGKALPTV